jgi:hypothetical protein
MKQRTVRTPKKRCAFLTALAAGHSVTTACQLSRLGRTAAYAWRSDDPAFAAEWQDAADAGIDLLEDEARRRAMAGSDLLLIFLLRNRRPAVYRPPKTLQIDSVVHEPPRSAPVLVIQPVAALHRVTDRGD